MCPGVRPAGTGFALEEPDPVPLPSGFDPGATADAVARGPGEEGVGVDAVVGFVGEGLSLGHSVGSGGVGRGPIPMLGSGVGGRQGSEAPRPKGARPAPKARVTGPRPPRSAIRQATASSRDRPARFDERSAMPNGSEV